MTRDEIIDVAQKTLAPLREYEAKWHRQIMEYHERGYDPPGHLYEAIKCNRSEMERWTAYFANMLALIPMGGFFMVGSPDDIEAAGNEIQSHVSPQANHSSAGNMRQQQAGAEAPAECAPEASKGPAQDERDQ